MKIRGYKKQDESSVREIFAKYWTDNGFLEELHEKLNIYVEKSEEYYTSAYRFCVAEKNDEIVGIGGFRVAPKYLKELSKTTNPAELYVIASKSKGGGVGSSLIQAMTEDAKRLHFTEMVCYSPETHDGSWKFYDKHGFIKHGIIKDPDDGYPGMLWNVIL